MDLRSGVSVGSFVVIEIRRRCKRGRHFYILLYSQGFIVADHLPTGTGVFI